MTQRSPFLRGQEHWPRLRTGTYGQRLRPLNTSTMVPQLLPHDCTHPEESLKRGGNARQKYIACNVCLERILSADNTQCFIRTRVVIGTLANAAAMSGSLVSGTDVPLTNSLHQSLDRTGFSTMASHHPGVHFSDSDSRAEQEARDQTSNPSSLGSRARRKTNAELGRRKHSVATRPSDWLTQWPDFPTAPGDVAGCDEFRCPGTVISSRDGKEMQSMVNGPSRKKPLGQSVRLTIVLSCGKLLVDAQVSWLILLQEVVILSRNITGMGSGTVFDTGQVVA